MPSLLRDVPVLWRLFARFVKGYILAKNTQIFGTKKSSDTRKAERFYKERGIKIQSVDMKEKGLSKGELTSVVQAIGGLDVLLD